MENLYTPCSWGSLLLGAQNSLGASRSARIRWLGPRLPNSWCRDSDGGLGPRRFTRASCLRPGRWAGLSWALRGHQLWGHFGFALRRPFPLLGARRD